MQRKFECHQILGGSLLKMSWGWYNANQLGDVFFLKENSFHECLFIFEPLNAVKKAVRRMKKGLWSLKMQTAAIIPVIISAIKAYVGE